MTSFQFVGIAPVVDAASAGMHSYNAADAVAGYVEPTGDQPAYQNRWEMRGVADFDEPTAEGNTPAEVLDALMANAATDNPTEVGLWTNAQVYGPYTPAPGEKAKLVYTYVAGSGAEDRRPGRTAAGSVAVGNGRHQGRPGPGRAGDCGAHGARPVRGTRPVMTSLTARLTLTSSSAAMKTPR